MDKNGYNKKLLLLPFKRDILILFSLGFLSSLFYLAAPYFSKLFIDTSFANRDAGSFLKFTLAGAGIFCFSLFFKALVDLTRSRLRVRIRLRLANRFISKLHSLDLAFFEGQPVGETIYRISDTDRVSVFIVELLPNFLVTIFRAFVVLGISFLLNTSLTMVVVIASPVFFLQNTYLRRKLKPVYEEIWNRNSLFFKKVQEGFSKVLIIKASGLENFQKRLYLKTLADILRLNVKNIRWSIVSSLSSTFISKAIFGIISVYGGWLIIKGRMTLGGYTASMIYITQLGGLINSLGLNFEYFVHDAISLSRFFEVMEAEPKIKDTPGAVALSSIKDEIRLEGIHFGYDPDKPVLSNVSIGIRGGNWIGLVGPSGCGKTTMVNLILRLYDPWGGTITLDGLDLRKLTLRSLRSRIAVATQEPLLFDLSFAENISYGMRGVGREKVEAAARLAQLHDFIIRLPRQYDTVIGENACRLSQGYKQRVALARAICRDTDLLILDEATSSIDSATEEKIINALRIARGGRSTIIISHRLSTIKDAEQVYFFRSDGRIEEGSHRELLDTSRFYREFFQNQVG